MALEVAELLPDDCPVSFLDEARFIAQTCKDMSAWWERAAQGDWLIWTAGNLSCDSRLLVSAACACVRTSLCFVPPKEMGPRKAVELAEQWTRGEVSAAVCVDAGNALHAACKAEQFGDGDHALAAMTVVGAAEAAVSAAGYATDATLCVRLTANAVRRTVLAYARASGENARKVADAKCAKIIRGLIAVVNESGVWKATAKV